MAPAGTDAAAPYLEPGKIGSLNPVCAGRPTRADP